MQRVFLLFADLLRPWHDNGLSEELQFGEIEAEGFIRGAMLRAALLSVSQNMAFGIFDFIGQQYAWRAARAWRPRELLLMEDVSLAFNDVWPRATKGQSVPAIPIERTVETLFRYFEYLREHRSRQKLRDALEQYIEEERLYSQVNDSESETEA